MRTRRLSKKLILFLTLSCLTLLVTCSKKIVNNSTEAISFQLTVSFKNSQLAELVETYQVTIISASDTIVAELEMVDGVVEGTIENVPEGTDRLVILEGLDSEGNVIYRGSAVIDVVAGQITDVEIVLLPVVKLIRTSPKFLETDFGTPINTAIELYNLTGITAIAVTLEYNNEILQLDSVSMGPGLPSETTFLDNDSASPGSLTIIAFTIGATPLVDTSGNAVLAIAHFRATTAGPCIDSTTIEIRLNSPSDSSIPPQDILTDNSQIIINRSVLKLSSNSLQFGFGVPGLSLAFQAIEITDSCGNSIPFTISTEQDWIDLNAKFGGLTPDSIYIDVDTTGLTTGSYEGSFIVQSPNAVNSPVEVGVTFQLDRGVRTLVVEPFVLNFFAEEFGALPASQQFTISELNSFNIPLSVSENISWLELSDTTGTTEQVITANITSTELAPGTYTDSIEIISSESNNSPQYVRVNYTIGNVPKFLEAEPDSIYFEFVQNSGDYPAEQLRIFESQGISIPYSVIEDVEWLLLSDTSGMTDDTITVYPNPNTAPGLYVDSLWITSDAAEIGAINVKTILNVIEEPKYLVVSPDSLNFRFVLYSVEPNPPLDTFTVTELDGKILPFSVTENIPWLSLLDVGEFTPSQVSLGVSQKNEPGIYVDSIEISSDHALNSPIYVVAVYEVIFRDPPGFVLSPDTLYFSADENSTLPDSDKFQVSSTVYDVSFVVTESIPWLNISPEEGDTESFVSVDITSTGLEPSVYFDSIKIELFASTIFEPVYEYIEYTVVDTIPPSPITDLAVDSNSLNSAYVSWTASGDDSTVGTATVTDLRYSPNLSTLLNWNGATQATGEPAPQVSGSSEQFEVVSLEPGNMYYFGLEIIDNASNRSDISNIDSVYLPNLVPDPPLLISPDSGAIDILVNVTFIWHSAARANSYQLQIDTSVSFSNPLIFPNINDTVFLVEPLDYETTYDWRVKAFNDGGSSDWSNIWSFTTESRPPTIGGIVSDDNNNPISGAVVKVYDIYPTGNVLDSTLTDENGAFEFFNISGTIEIRIFKTDYYPELTEVITPDTSLTISLTGLGTFTVTDKWIDLYCESAMVHGHLVQPNDVVESYDPDGNLCGRFVVNVAGAYGFMPVYRDDEFSTVDEGCVYGDAVTIKVNQEVAELQQPMVYPVDYQNFEVCFDVTGEILSWILILEPASGETFFIDSSAAIKWSSNGTSDTLELYLTNPLISHILLEKIANDGEHTLTIPRTAFKSNDWSFVLVDATSSISDTSNQFTIDAVELVFAPDTLRILGAANKCTPSTQTFEISESHNFLIPYFGSESITWLSITNSEGNTSSIVDVVTDISGLPLGTYFDSIKIESPDAFNSPAYVYVELDLREYLCGDFNDDCELRIGDLSNLIDYLYRAGPPPLSTEAMNVDRCGGLDIADVEFWYDNFSFSNESNCDGAEICTNSGNDMGTADSLKLIVSQPPLFVDSLYKLRLDLYLFNDANVVNGLAVGFDWDNNYLSLDSVIFSEQVENSLSLLRVAFESDDIDTSNANQRFLFAGNRSLFPGLQASASQKLLASYYFSLSDWNASDSIVIDTLTFNEGTTYKVVSANGTYQVVWQGPLVIRNESSDK